MNWITKTKDQFAERSPGVMVNSASSLAMFPGLIITVAGILGNV